MASALDENLAGLIGPLLSHLDGNANKAMPPRMPGDGVESGDKEKLMFESAILQDLNLSPTKTKGNGLNQTESKKNAPYRREIVRSQGAVRKQAHRPDPLQ